MACTSTTQQTIKYLQSLAAVRDRANQVYNLAIKGELQHFDFDPSKLEDVADYVLALINRDYANPADVPQHGRWRSYNIQVEGRSRDLVMEHVEKWRGAGVDSIECCRRVIDLFVVSVLIDAGAGPHWSYHDSALGLSLARTEGLGIAALRMFESGSFSSAGDQPHRADSVALKVLSDEVLLKGFQVSETNPLLGASSRAQLLRNLGSALEASPQFFGNSHPPRPGNMIDYLAEHSQGGSVAIEKLWEIIMDGFKPVWPSTRTKLDGTSLGDVWPYDGLAGDADDAQNLLPFHKLSQWLCWSISEVVVKLGCLELDNVGLLTGLPEYRNGGLFVDMDILKLKSADHQRGVANISMGDESPYSIPCFEVNDQVVVEWRAMTVALLDRTHDLICNKLGCSQDEFNLAKVLEGGTWKAGRELAAQNRPETKEPPINIVSDGTVF